MLENFFPCDSEHAILRKRCLQSFDDIYQVMQNWGEGSSSDIGRLGRLHLTLHNMLAEESMGPWSEGWMFWRVYPKHHLMLHLLESQVALSDNPLLSWAYRDENEIGLAACVAETAHPRGLGRLLLEKYRHWCSKPLV